MAIEFEGSIDNINERQLAFIREVLEKRGYKNIKVKIDPVGAAGDNYIANVKRITVSDDNGIFKMIVKIAPQSETTRTAVNTQLLFKNEHRMYTEVLPKFQELEVKKEVPNNDRLRFAECYGSLSEAPDEIILLEDLQMSDFVMVDKFKSLSDEYVKSILKNFAILHSLSYALKNIEPETFKSIKSDYFDMWATMAAIPQTLSQFIYFEKELEDMLDNEIQKAAIRGSLTNFLNLSVELSESEVDDKYSVIQQGDPWTNNFMFKFHGDKLQQSIMIDYQLSKESNPARDILYMIFNCTDHKTRLEHYHDWIDYYHSELDKRLANFDLKADDVYSRDQLDADLKKYSRLSFGLSVILSRFTTMQSDDAQAMKDAMATTDSVQDDAVLTMSNFDKSYVLFYKAKLQDLIDSCLHFELF